MPSIGPADPAVIEDPDIYRAAKLLIDQHGEDAARRAAQKTLRSRGKPDTPG